MARQIARLATSLLAAAMFYASCVSAVQAQGHEADVSGSARFVDNRDEAITDLKTGLMWQAGDSRDPVEPSDGAKYAQTMQVAHYHDWRLPTRDELAELYDTLATASENEKDRRVAPFY